MKKVHHKLLTKSVENFEGKKKIEMEKIIKKIKLEKNDPKNFQSEKFGTMVYILMTCSITVRLVQVQQTRRLTTKVSWPGLTVDVSE